MNQQNISEHFCRLQAVMKNYDVNDLSRITNLAESAFLKNVITLGRSKCIVEKERTGKATKSRFRDNYDHVKGMPGIPASGQDSTPLFAHPGTEHTYKRQGDSSWELSPHFCLNQTKFHVTCCYRLYKYFNRLQNLLLMMHCLWDGIKRSLFL